MVITNRNTIVNKKKKGEQVATKEFHNATGQVTTDPEEQRQIQRKVDMNIKGKTTISKTGQTLTKEEIKQVQALKQQPTANVGAVSPEASQALAQEPNIIRQMDAANLAKQQSEELKKVQTSTLDSPEILKSQLDRNAAAGIAAGNAALANFGLSGNVNPSLAVKNESPIIKVPLAIIGLLAGTNIGGFSLSTLFSSSQRSGDNIKRDIAENRGNAKEVATFASSKGADINDAIATLKVLEESTNLKYNQLATNLRDNPRDIQSGLDYMDSAVRDKEYILKLRQA